MGLRQASKKAIEILPPRLEKQTKFCKTLLAEVLLVFWFLRSGNRYRHASQWLTAMIPHKKRNLLPPRLRNQKTKRTSASNVLQNLVCFSNRGGKISIAFFDACLNPITYVAKPLQLRYFCRSFSALVRISIYTHHPNFRTHQSQEYKRP